MESFEWGTALIERSDRQEVRYVATGYIGDRLHKVVFTERHDVIRIISLRKANRREEIRYAQA